MIAKIATRASYLLFFTLLSIFASAQSKADFTSDIVSGCSPVIVQFFDRSTGQPDSWKWDLGNGTTSFLQNPSVTYFNPGTYDVTLITTKSGVSDTIVKKAYITVYAKPTTIFGSNVISGCYPLTVQFTDSSETGSGSISKWQWDFGDGYGSELQHPSHVYENTGDYNVTLYVRNSNGCASSIVKSAYIKITNGVKANFTNNSPKICAAPVTFDFQNLSTGTGTMQYAWDFGDGSTSTEENPRHIYTNQGTYSVKLIVTTEYGCVDTIIKKNLVSIGSVKAGFTAPNAVCAGSKASFTNTSTPAPSSVIWNFGDGTTSTDLNPQKIFSTPGIYDVKLIANFGACQDSVTRKITINAKPIVDFTTGSLTVSCKTPLTVNFVNTTDNAVSYKWYFGDGDSSSSSNPTHTYTKAGNFTVSLVATNASGCSERIDKSNFVRINLPYVGLNNLPDSGCAPFTKSFSFNSNLGSDITSILWDFGDGNTSTAQSPSHTYDNPGKYSVTLIAANADGCSDTAFIADAVIANSIPEAKFSATPTSVCAQEKVIFTNESLGDPQRFLWEFGDKTTSIEKSPEHLYSDTGYFDVQLIVWNGGCPDTLKVEDYIFIKAPIAKFKTTIDCANPFVKEFTDKSIGADTWNWDFGDGNTSVEQNPRHTYAATGSYEVSLTVYNNTTGCSYTTKQLVPVVVSKANFYATDSSVCRNQQVTLSVPAINRAFMASYAWDLGNGVIQPSTAPFTNYTYTTTGTYTITLVATNVLGCKDTVVKPNYIQVNGPTARFESGAVNTCLKARVKFSDRSKDDGLHPIDLWIWNYGDGTVDTTYNLLNGRPADTVANMTVEHTYKVAGFYTVALRAIDSKGCADNYTLPTQILVSQPRAAFSSTDPPSCPGKQIKFSNTSFGTDLTYTWDFGDAAISTATSPSHMYLNEGDYTVKLAVKDRFGCTDTITKNEYVKIVLPRAAFRMSDSISSCPPLMVNFSDMSVNAVSKKWDFGDGNFSTIANPSHFYTYPGEYTVKQIITSPGGCIDIVEKKIYIKGPRGSFSYDPLTGCKPVKINFKGTTLDKASFVWDFSDGNILKTKDSVVSHTYEYFGGYLPRMILVDAQGCSVAINGKDTINVNGAEPKFHFEKTIVCDSATIVFADSSKSYDKIVNYTWDFGDGTISNNTKGSHTYTKQGLYTPKLTVKTEFGCSDTVYSPSPIKVITSPKIDISKTFSGCVPLDATFRGVVLEKDTSALYWNWSLGNGNQSTLQNPAMQVYDQVGKHNIDLTVTNSSGCVTSVSKQIEVFPLPDVSAGIDTMICKGNSVQLTATGAGKYIWKTEGSLSCLNCESTSAKPTVDTRYFVTGTSSYGCVDTASVLVRVKQPFKISVSRGDTLCKGESMKLSVTGANTYAWYPNAGLDNPVSDNPTAKPDTTTTYMVVGTDDRHCFNDTAHVRVKVYPIPTVELGADKTINIGQSITLKPELSSDITVTNWTPSTGIINRNGISQVTIKPKETTEYSIQVSNPGGCRAEDKMTIIVICNGGNIFVPNTFSPNGDGINDVFYPRGTGLYNIKSLRIFNRWGEVVFERQNFKANDQQAGWDGKVKGMKLNSDVFVYTMEIVCDNNEVMTTKGNIAIIN